SVRFSCTDTPTTMLDTLSLHDALPIYRAVETVGLALEVGDRVDVVHVLGHRQVEVGAVVPGTERLVVVLVALGVLDVGLLGPGRDRKSTRLNSSHVSISYAVFCLKKKK